MGKLVDAGNVLYARYGDRGGETYEAVRFNNRDKVSYYTRDARFTGQVNTLMRKPLGGNNVRLSPVLAPVFIPFMGIGVCTMGLIMRHPAARPFMRLEMA